jgi:hypothetical protein
VSRYATTDQTNRWARIRELLTEQERTLLFNAMQDKARGDREAAADAMRHGHAAGSDITRTMLDQAELAEDMADQVLA